MSDPNKDLEDLEREAARRAKEEAKAPCCETWCGNK